MIEVKVSDDPPFHDLDIAEVTALRGLQQLQDGVNAFHKPGLDIRIRIEDTGARHLFGHDPAIESYSTTLSDLVYALGMEHFTMPVRESTLASMSDYLRDVAAILPALHGFLSHKLPLSALEPFGWQGDIGDRQRQHYMGLYETLYPGSTMDEKLQKLATYFAGSWARRKLGMTGDSPAWNHGYLSISFVAPIPGAPDGLFSTRLYRRTLPAYSTRTHIAPWRAKGYLRIENDNLAIPKLASFQDLPDLNHCTVTIEGTRSARVSVDYTT